MVHGGLTPRSRRAPTAGHQGQPAGTVYILCWLALASHRRCRLSSNVRHQNAAVVAAPAGSAAFSAEDQTATGRHSRIQHRNPRTPRASVAAGTSEVLCLGQETTSQLFVVSGQRFAGSGCGPGKRGLSGSSSCLPPLTAPRASLRLLSGVRQATGQAASSARGGLPLARVHQGQVFQWHTAPPRATAKTDA